MKLDWSNYEAEADAATTPEKCFMAAALGGRNCFLTGMAGTGKSTLLRQFIEASPRAVDVTAPTGVAALNVGGMTLHRFCGMRLGPQAGERNAEYYQKLLDEHHPAITAAFKRVRECRVLVIDEISMLPGRLLDFVDFLFREERDCKEPFGGCQIIATGDFLQLPPVRTSEIAPYDWAFLSQAWKNAEFKTDILETVRRQDEPEFVRALADFRLGKVWGQTARILQSRIRSFPPSNLTRLFTPGAKMVESGSMLNGKPVNTLVELIAKNPKQPISGDIGWAPEVAPKLTPSADVPAFVKANAGPGKL